MQKSKPNHVSLSKATIEKLRPPAKGRRYVYDTKTTGLTICVTAAGSKTFYLLRKIEGRTERIRIGTWPEWSATRARDKAAELMGKMAEGENPADKRRETRQAPTFREIFDVFIDLPTRTKAKRPKSAKTVKDYRLQFERYLKDWHDRQLSKVTRVDVERLHNRLSKESGRYTANRVLSLVKVLYNTATDQGLYDGNPAARVKPFEEEQRERFLQADELQRFFDALETEATEKVRDFLLVALFTGQRRGNVTRMKWEDVNLERAVWKMPETKTGKHSVPLTGEVLDILQRRKSEANGSDYVFPGRHKGHLADPMGQWRAVLKKAGIEDLRIHDLRRSLGSWQAIGGTSLTIIGKGLGHKRPETTAIYAHLTDEPVRTAMEAAAAAMRAAAKGGQKTE